MELTNGTYRDIEEKISSGRLDCGSLSSIEDDPLVFLPLLEDEIFVIMASDDPLTSKKACLCRN